MFNTPAQVPDRISTLELSKLWLLKAFENLERELEASSAQDEQSIEDAEDDSADQI